ncbi:MAG TPA: phosphatase PAP2 family protein [Planctomycetaceae bacterium]|nr:phosphatase PAP2 family protein [Planctomycetaceae bacterium]
MAGRVSFPTPRYWFAAVWLVLTPPLVQASDYPDRLFELQTNRLRPASIYDQGDDPFQRQSDFSGSDARLLQTGYSIDLENRTERDLSDRAAGYRGLSEFETRLSAHADEFIGEDDLIAIPPQDASGFETEPIWQDEWSTFGRGMSLGEFVRNDAKLTFFSLEDDFRAFWKPRNVLFVGTGLGLGIGLRQSVDDDTREYVNRHPRRWGSFTESLGMMGNTEYQIAAIFALYGYSFRTENAELMEFTQLLIRTYTLTGLSTVTIKVIANTERPSTQWMNGDFGFPSAHSSTSFAIAATIEEYYGPRAGIPAYLLAGLIGWSRIDEQNHDVSDVVFGAVLGYAIAKSVAGHHLRGDSRIQFFPWTDPNRGTYGAMFQVDY